MNVLAEVPKTMFRRCLDDVGRKMQIKGYQAGGQSSLWLFYRNGIPCTYIVLPRYVVDLLIDDRTVTLK